MNHPSSAAPIDVPVLIVGGGPVGLTTSLLLSRDGIESLLVERHPGTAVLPKARAINARSMEMYRQLGLEPDIRAAGMDPKFGRMILWAESLSGAEIKRLEPGRNSLDSQKTSPVTKCGCAQDVFEPVLRRHAELAGVGRLRFSTQLAELHPTREGATATLVDALSGAKQTVRARYVVAADGSQSMLRRQLGVQMLGERDVYDSVNIHFKADLTPWTADRPAALYLIEQPELRGTFLTIDGSKRWSFLVTSLSAYGYRAEEFDEEFCARIIRQAVGTERLDIEVLGIGSWTASAIVADRYRDGPVFLAGDAAHEMPPTGGLGLNTGVQDAQNLAWKLAAVLKGQAGEHLLDSYDAERRPLGVLTTHSSLLNALSMGRRTRQETAVLPREQYLNERGLVFGFCYESDAVLPEAQERKPAGDPVTDYIPSARPGCRAPHMWLNRGGERISTIDLFGRGFVLLTGAQGAAWAAFAKRYPRADIRVHVIGAELTDAEGNWQALYGIRPEGAVLVRPDGIVGWRSHDGQDGEERLAAAMDRILGSTAALAVETATQPGA